MSAPNPPLTGEASPVRDYQIVLVNNMDVESWPRWEPTIGLAWLSDGMTEIHEGSTGKVRILGT